MSKRESHITHLFAAELQFRLASAVRLATTMEKQPLDLPMEWTHGQHTVRYEEVALRLDQADHAAWHLHRTATYTMAVAIKDAIEAVAPGLPNAVRKDDIKGQVLRVIEGVEAKPWLCSDDDVATAHHIARLIRNAYAHAPFAPIWGVGGNLQDTVLDIPDVIRLDTTNLDGTPFEWGHYGGPLAMFRFCRFVRIQVLGDKLSTREAVPIPVNIIHQQGDLIFQKVDAIPPDAVPIDIEPLPDGGIPLGGGHVLYPRDRKQEDDA